MANSRIDNRRQTVSLSNDTVSITATQTTYNVAAVSSVSLHTSIANTSSSQSLFSISVPWNTSTSVTAAVTLFSATPISSNTTLPTAISTASSNFSSSLPICGFGEVNRGSWVKDNIDIWTLQWWSNYSQTIAPGNDWMNGSTGPANFTSVLKEQFAPNVAESAFTCNVYQQCSVSTSSKMGYVR